MIIENQFNVGQGNRNITFSYQPMPIVDQEFFQIFYQSDIYHAHVVKAISCLDTWHSCTRLHHHWSNLNILHCKRTNRGPYKQISGFCVFLIVSLFQPYIWKRAVYSWAWTPRPCAAEWILLWWESGGGSTPLPSFDSSRAWLLLSLLWHAHEYLCLCMWKKENSYRNKYYTLRMCVCVCVCLCVYTSGLVCVGNTSNGRLMIGLIDTQQWMRAFVSSRDALWKA